MIQAAIAAVMWLLVGWLLIFRRGRPDRSITYASLSIAAAMTFNVNVVYEFVDSIMGRANLTTLFSDGLFVIGMFFLGRGVMRAGEYRPWLVRAALSLPALIAALVVITVLFFFIDRGSTTTSFMLDLGDQPFAAAYSIVEFSYCVIVIGSMFTLVLRQFIVFSGWCRIPAALLIVGAISGLGLCLVTIIMDAAHLVGALDLMRSLGTAYDVLSLLAFVFLCAGLAGQPAARLLYRHFRDRRTVSLLQDLETAWSRASQARPGPGAQAPEFLNPDDHESRLHRMVVEVHDALIDRRTDFTLSQEERALLDKAERHLLGPTRPRVEADLASLPRDDTQEAIV